MKRDELAPVEVIALDIARCDMHYAATSLSSLSPPAAAAEVAKAARVLRCPKT